MTTPLAAALRARIAAEGPIPVAAFMEAALADPVHGYYRGRDPLGRGGDFTTAPEISQVFGELIGLWCATVWQAMGMPAPVRLVELGPGRGTLMADLLRAARMVPPFAAALDVHLVETSAPLRARQRAALGDRHATWHEALADVPPGPTLLVANEFFDALPVEQHVRDGDAWRRRMVAVGDDGGFRFVLGPEAAPPLPAAVLGAAADGAVAESCPAARAVAAGIGHRLATQGGAALIVDYGHVEPGLGDTLQAVRGHAYAPALADPGAADLTAHVDFAALAAAAGPAVKAHGPLRQGTFLRRIGAEMRAMQLARANPAKAQDVIGACARLIDPQEMGTLFKVLALSHASLATLPGFETPDRPPSER